jgi:Arylsulfotransferase (ASST)
LPIVGTAETLACEARKIYEDIILVLNPEGGTVRKISVLRSLFDSGYGGLIYMTQAPCDPLHLNDVRVLDERDVSEYPELSAGDLLISMRNINTVAIMDQTTARIKWIASGLTLRQHAPRVLVRTKFWFSTTLAGCPKKEAADLPPLI